MLLTGIEVETPDGCVKSHAMLLLCTTDLPAQAQVLNMKYFNGKFGCAHCENEGTPRVSCPRVRDWPYKSGVTLCTHSRIMQQARYAISQHNAVRLALM